MAYVMAGASHDSRDYSKAIARIEDAKRLIGGKSRTSIPFYFSLRAALIYFDAGILDKSRANLMKAMETVKSLRRIPDIDRDYILDYCDLLLADILNDRGRMEYRVHDEHYGEVNARYRKEYPIRWPEPDSAAISTDHGEEKNK